MQVLAHNVARRLRSAQVSLVYLLSQQTHQTTFSHHTLACASPDSARCARFAASLIILLTVLLLSSCQDKAAFGWKVLIKSWLARPRSAETYNRRKVHFRKVLRNWRQPHLMIGLMAYPLQVLCSKWRPTYIPIEASISTRAIDSKMLALGLAKISPSPSSSCPFHQWCVN